MVKENSFGLIKVHTTVTFSKITFMDRENISGPMAEFIMDNGLTTKWKGKELSLGAMDVDMKETTKTIRSTVTELSNGQTVGNT